MRQMLSSAALKKVKKNVKRHFNDEEAPELHKVLSKKLFRNLVEIFDLISYPCEQVPHEDTDLTSMTNDLLEALYNGPLTIDPLDVEANELIQLLSSPVWRSFSTAYTEITTSHFDMPELPEIAFTMSGLGGNYTNIGSLLASRASNLQIAAKSLTDGVVKDIGNGISYELYNSRSMMYGPGSEKVYTDVRRNEATLTGGGDGPALPPVDGAVKMIGIQKNYGEDLGITVTQQQYMSGHYGLVKELVIKRILAASRVEQLDLLHVGDVIREANGVPVDNPEVLQKVLKNASGNVTLKIIPGYQSTPISSQLFLRAHFSYDPKNDNLIPCKEAGLKFSAGSILQVLKQEDPYWWQARHHNQDGRAGLIPSIVLQERRKAFIQSAPNPDELTYKMFACGLARRRKKKVTIPFCARDADTYDTKDIVLYEEVAMVSGFQRPVVCLIGAPGVGRRSLRNMLIRANRERYAAVVAHTSKELDIGEEDDGEFIVESKAKMEMDNLKNKYLEFGEYEDNFYGTKYDSIREVVKAGRTCLLDCSVQAVSKLRNSEFMPYVIFLAAPSVSCMKAMYEYGMSMGFTEKWKRDETFRKTLETSTEIERNYNYLIDLILLCDNIETTFEQLNFHLNNLLTEPQWVPAKWLY
ncbi:MAGUK p55 subfamily member 6 [Schistosoma japonicum]|uniref:MAGUK p55 subfamily member 6 n=2 Tax=Schistosoma japonicum TaxID=6182 RepID=C1L3P4_SCHJA|nr:MAGUK p55 subfamily member 6 [Schistosoma japonicum]KAH8852496.1 MAGUK p55 subfamily member 6 [Schistosoma japonicum]TNN20682.1 MAGUK p55 subfamily member 6 [Schistosoma japonicum]CAX69322.1 MAGUK p55 subfamily member 6 [Schistosoma japonicum]